MASNLGLGLAWDLPLEHKAAAVGLHVIVDKVKYVLMVQMRKKDKKTEQWDETVSFPGGKIDATNPRERVDAWQTALRELREETGGVFAEDKIKVTRVARNNSWVRYLKGEIEAKEAFIVPTFICDYTGDDAVACIQRFRPVKDGEVTALYWVSLDDLKNLKPVEDSAAYVRLFKENKNLELDDVRTIPPCERPLVAASYVMRTVFTDF